MADWTSAIPAIAQAAGSLIGQQKQNAASEQDIQLQRDAYNRALALLQGGQLNAPDVKLGRSEQADVYADPEAQLAQRDALMQLQEQARNGYDDIDRAAVNRTMAEAGQQERSQREAVLARLDPGSGAAIQARLQAQQSGANRASQQAMDINAERAQRKMAALQALGGLSTQMRGQSFNEGMGRAQGQDAISKFNAETSRFNNQANIGNQLQALQLAGGAGNNLGGRVMNQGNMQANQSVANGKMVGNGVYAALNQPKDNPTGSPPPTPPPNTQAEPGLYGEVNTWDPYPESKGYDIRDEDDK